jgi:hypothetical protein
MTQPLNSLKMEMLLNKINDIYGAVIKDGKGKFIRYGIKLERVEQF